MEHLDDDSVEETLTKSIADMTDSLETLRSLSRLGQDQGYDINSRLR